MKITETIMIAVPSNYEGQAYADELCHLYRTMGIAYRREDSTVGIVIMTETFYEKGGASEEQ